MPAKFSTAVKAAFALLRPPKILSRCRQKKNPATGAGFYKFTR
jgi:hypothetical protein